MDDLKVVTVGVAKQIAEQIRASILEGRLTPNEKLPTEEEMAARFGVSRPTVREALKRLAAQNLIRSKRGPGGGNFVNETTLDQVAPIVTEAATMLATLSEFPMDDVFEARLELEGVCLRRAIEIGDPALAQRLAVELDIQRDEAISDEEFCASDVRFHRTIVDACGNLFIRLALYTVTEALMPITNMIITRTRSRSVMVERHDALARAIAERDAAAAQAALAEVIAYRRGEYAKAADRR